MEVFVLGSGVGVPNLKRGYPGFFIKSGVERILVDPGPASVRQLLKLGVHYNDVTSIILTHFHPDHCLDFISFLFTCKYPLAPRKEDLSVIGPLGLKNFYERLVDVFGDTIVSGDFQLRLKEVSESSVSIGKAEVITKSVSHTENSIGIRYRDIEGKVLCYSGDTDYCDAIVELAKDTDLLILESSFPDEGKVKGHLTPSYAGRIAREAGVRSLLLTHFYPMCDDYDIVSQCRKEFKGNIQLAYDLMRIDV